MRGTASLKKLLALFFVSALVLTACGDDGDDTATDDTDTTAGGGDGGVACEDVALGFFGALTGPNANLGINERNGMKLAIDQFNEENADCQVELVEFDSAGDPNQAPQLAQEAVQNDSVIGIVGPAFSGESRTANPIFDEAALTIITASATGVDLSENGWKIFHRGVGNDNSQGPAIATYVKDELGAKSVAVLDDKSEYGKGIADIVREELGDAVEVNDSFDDKTTEFSSTVNKVKAAKVDAVVFGGYYSQAGPLAKQLKEGGVEAQFIAPDGSLDPAFVEGAGDEAAEGAILTAPSAPTTGVEGAEDVLTAYEEAFGTEAGLYSLEAYDAANIFLECIKEGNTTREDMETCVDGIEFDGLTKSYKFDENGELAGDVAIFAYTIKGGEIEGVGPIGGDAEGGDTSTGTGSGTGTGTGDDEETTTTSADEEEDATTTTEG